MTEPHKRPHRHPKDKTAYRVKNWRQYDQALRDRGDITLWLSQDAIDAWTPPMTGKRGAQAVYADLAIETALTLRLLFHLPLRQTEGLLGSVLQRMDVPLPCPAHTTLSWRPPTVAIRQQVDRASAGPLSLIVDSSGLQVCGQGEWHAQTLNLSHFVARQIWRRRSASPCRGRTHRLQRRKPLRGLRRPMTTTLALLPT